MSQWIIIGLVIIICPLMHFFMMRKSHKNSDEEHKMAEGEGKNKDENNKHKSGGCCH